MPTSTAPAAAERTSDRAVFAAVLLLSAVGVAAVFSAVGFFAVTRGGDPQSFLVRHLLRVGLALGALAAFSYVDYRRLARYSRFGVMVALGLLVAVQVLGAVTHGAQRWLDFGPVGFQPSDLAVFALIVHTAVLLARKQPYIGDWHRGFVPLAVWAAPTVLLIGVDNLSSAALLCATLGAMYVVGRVRAAHLGAVALAGLVLAVGMLAVSPGRADRVDAFLGTSLFSDSETVHDRQDEGYQADQARIAFAMGGLTGVGPGKSVQRDFLPAPYNDFIFAIIAEEYGLLGAGLVLLVFVWVLGRGFLRVARSAPDPLGLFLAVGLTTSVVLHGFVNAMVATGLMPVTGLPMPFVSYGGTSLLVTGAMMGLLLNVSRHATTD